MTAAKGRTTRAQWHLLEVVPMNILRVLVYIVLVLLVAAVLWSMLAVVF